MKIVMCWTFRKVCLIFVVLLGFLSVQGCVSTTQEEIRQADTGIGEDEVIAILRRARLSGDETEQDFLDCVVARTSNGSDGLEVISNQAFVDALYPWFEWRTAPNDVRDMEQYSRIDKIKHRLETMGVRYIVWIDGITKRENQNGSVQCAVATGGIPACFGFLSWRAESLYEAVIWDIERGISVGKLSAESKGMSFVPAIVIPIPFIARTQSSACASLANQLKDFIDD